eukprot:6835147-Karenia_brevis.AAC.1
MSRESQGRQQELKDMLQQEYGVPHREEALAMLVPVKIVGGDADLAEHSQGLTMRAHVLEQLIAILRMAGHAGYERH